MSAASLSKSLRLSSTLKMEEEAINMKQQGIGSILGSDSERSKSSSLRRTLSADMSSKKWLTQHGFSPMKKIASTEEFSSVSSITDSSEEEEEEEENYRDRKESDEPQSQFDIWSSIQQDKYNKELEKPGQFDMWSSIISQKEQEASNKTLALPYIHPLVKRSAGSLTKKSLEVCTESLGSETGSDGFSSYPPSETGTDVEEDKEIDQPEQIPQESFDVEDIQIPKYNYVVGKKSPQRSFPPPISSLSCGDGASIRMQSRRDNGRLVLEAVSVPSTNNFLAQRQDGRLVLTFIDTHSTEQQLPKNDEEAEEEDVFDNNFEEEDDEETEEEEKEMEFEMEQAPKLSTGVISLHRLTLMMKNKHSGVANKNPTWPNKFNEVVKFDDAEEIDQPTMVAQSLPPPPRMARLIPKTPVNVTAAATATTTVAATAGASFNAYEYYWRPKPAMATTGTVVVDDPMKQQPATQSKGNNGKLIINSKNPMENYEQKELLDLRGNYKGDHLVPLLKSCKEPRRSLLFWEPHCIATS
ncbi:hypothetical protein JRO89_XS10G0210400 [Xanthoceras sorbifolium]|uniref:FAF domain-containing protein n=1 Tax=Xanthoceras sorbifolium TaxID=99658 RepID=A0ABQ8HJS7_9ROSI|nr:hypothetical protein JRO89_XS10G0210400 [Xanthoceras sorbifolium]